MVNKWSCWGAGPRCPDQQRRLHVPRIDAQAHWPLTATKAGGTLGQPLGLRYATRHRRVSLVRLGQDQSPQTDLGHASTPTTHLHLATLITSLGRSPDPPKSDNAPGQWTRSNATLARRKCSPARQQKLHKKKPRPRMAKAIRAACEHRPRGKAGGVACPGPPDRTSNSWRLSRLDAEGTEPGVMLRRSPP